MNLNKENDVNQNYGDIFRNYINLKREEMNFESSEKTLHATYQRRKASYVINEYDNGSIAKLPYYLLLCHIYEIKLSSDTTKNMEKYLELDEITSFFANFDNDDFSKVERAAKLIKEWLDLDFYTSHQIIDEYIHSVPTPLLDRLETATVEDYKDIIEEANTTKKELKNFPGSLAYLYDLKSENHADNIFHELGTVKNFYLPFLESWNEINEEDKSYLLKEFWPSLKDRIEEDHKKRLFYYPSIPWLPDYKIFIFYIIDAYKNFYSKKFYIEGSEESLVNNSIKIHDTISSIDKFIETLSDKNAYQYKIFKIKKEILNELAPSLSVDTMDQLLHDAFCDSSISVIDILDKIAVSASIKDIHDRTILLLKQLDSFTDPELGSLLLEGMRNHSKSLKSLSHDDAYQFRKLYK